MASKIRLGIVGAGSFALARHLPAVRRVPEFEVVSLCRRDAAALENACRTHGIPRRTTDWAEAVRSADVDAILVATPNHLHSRITVEALKAGKHVFCEKPPAVDAAGAAANERAAAESGKVLTYGFLMRFMANTRRTKELLRDGALGRVYHLHVNWLRRRGFPMKGSWFTNQQRSGGGCLMDIGSHMLDRALHLLSYPRVVGVYAATHRALPDTKIEIPASTGAKSGFTGVCDVEDLALALIRLDGGVTLTLEISFALNLRETPPYLDVLGTAAGAHLERDRSLTLFSEKDGYMTDIDLDVGAGNYDDLYMYQWQDFLGAIRDGKPLLCPASEGTRLMQVLDAVYASAKAGAEVKL